MSDSLFIAGGIIFVVLVLVVALLATIKKVPKDRVMIVTGFKQRTISGGIGIVIPLLERYDYLSLENMEIDVNTQGSMTSQGVPVNIDGYALIKINNARESILTAMEQFYSGNENTTKETIKRMAKNVLEGKLREIISEMTVEQIYKDRQEFGNRVQEVAVQELVDMGLEVKSFTIKDIDDDNGYLKALGEKDIAEVQKNAAVERSIRERETRVKTAEEEKMAQEAEIKARTEIAEKERDQALRVHSYKQEQETAKANADIAYELETRERQKDLTEKEMNIQLVKTQKEIEIQEELRKKKEKELDVTVRQPAEAEKFKEQQKADAEKYRRIAEAEASAAEIEKKGQAEINLIKDRGNAEAEAIKLKGLAEAESMRAKAEAYKLYGDAAIIDMMREVLPELAKAVSEPLSKTEKIVIVDNGDSKNGGAAKIANYSNSIMSQVPETLKALTGIDLIGMIQNNTESSLGKDTTVVEDTNDDESYKEV